MKRNIAIVAGGDTSEIVVSLRSAQGIYSFIDKEKYNLYIVEMEAVLNFIWTQMKLNGMRFKV